MRISDTLPRYLEIQRDLHARISSGDWRPGRRIPAEHELQADYACSRMTVSKALSALANAGLIVRNRRAGSFVAKPKTQQSVLEILDLKAEILASGRPYRFEMISRKQRPVAEEEIQSRGMPANGRVLALVVLHLAANEPYALEERLINLVAVPSASDEPFADTPPGTWLLNLIPWTEAEHRIRAEVPGAPAARRLGMSAGSACLVVERRTWQAGQPITWVRLTYPGDRHQLVSRFNPGDGLGS